MRRFLAALALVAALPLGACGGEKQQATETQTIAWREGDVQDALAEAKEAGKPIFLYWGAKWCPPCNQMKSTLFKDPAFIAQTRSFIPVYLDGDSPGAQKWGERFGISGYPTVIVLRQDGSEVTRLSSSATADKLASVLKVAAGRTMPIEELLTRAERDPKALSSEDWQLLTDFDWQNDPRHFGEPARAVALLDRLAETAPGRARQHRFALLAVLLGTEKGEDGKYALTGEQQSRIATVALQILGNPDEVIANRQELSYQLPDLIAALPPTPERAVLDSSLISALDVVYADADLPIPDRLATANADITLAKRDGGEVHRTVLAKVRERVAWADKSATDAMVRQSVISTAAGLLADAGDSAGARRLLEAELKRSASPYYYMLDLSRLAEDGKDARGAIDWARKAYENAEGSATRVQWAIEYSKAVMRLTPADKAAVEASAGAVIDELNKNPGGYYQRTRTKVGAWGKQLRTWSETKGGASVLARLQSRMSQVCAKQHDSAGTCQDWAKA